MGFSTIAYAFGRQPSTRDGMRDSSTVSAGNRRVTSSLSGRRVRWRILRYRCRASLSLRPCPKCKRIQVPGHPCQRGLAVSLVSCPMIRCGVPSRVQCSTEARTVTRYLCPNEQSTALAKAAQQRVGDRRRTSSELVHVQAFVAQPAVEGLDKGVFRTASTTASIQVQSSS